MSDKSTKPPLVIPFLRVSPDAKQPTRGSKEAMCWDFYSAVDYPILATDLTAVPTGIVAAIPKGYGLVLKCRSGLANSGASVEAGCIDSDYRGEIKVLLRHRGLLKAIQKGQKIAQGFLVEIPDATWHEVQSLEELSSTERGDRGFGSTGDF